MTPIVPDTYVIYCDPRLNHSVEIVPEFILDGTVDSFFRNNFRPEVATDVISGTDCRVCVYVGMEVRVFFVIPGQTVLEIYEPLTLRWTTMTTAVKS